MTTLSIQVDEKVEKEAEKLFADFGLDISTAVNIFLRQSIRENCIPFTSRRKFRMQIRSQQ
ncbi:MAG: type II toxin-antitoxin system RelB/DinJ family antitoxin [Faecalibacterium sp.]